MDIWLFCLVKLKIAGCPARAGVRNPGLENRGQVVQIHIAISVCVGRRRRVVEELTIGIPGVTVIGWWHGRTALTTLMTRRPDVCVWIRTSSKPTAALMPILMRPRMASFPARKSSSTWVVPLSRAFGSWWSIRTRNAARGSSPSSRSPTTKRRRDGWCGPPIGTRASTPPCQNSDRNHKSVQAPRRLPLVRVSAFSGLGGRFTWEGSCLIQPRPSAPPRRKGRRVRFGPAKHVLSGQDPFDEGTMIDDEEPPGLPSTHLPAFRLPSPSSK